MKSSDLFVNCLENEGVKYIFGIPGEENLDLLESIRNSSIQFILTRNEQSAVIMAATYGRLTGKSGVVLSTLGPGATNLITGIAYAQLGAMPLIAITGQKPMNSSRYGKFQMIDIVRLMEPISKSSTQIHSGNLIPSHIRNAFKLSQEERPGVVHLELPEDVAKQQTVAKSYQITKNRRPTADFRAMQSVSEAVKNSQNPVLLIGAGANRKRISVALTEFVEFTEIPFFATQMGKGVIDERSEKYLGTLTGSEGREYLHNILKDHDLIITVGHDHYENTPAFAASSQTKVISINFSNSEISDAFSPDIEIVGDIASSISYLTSRIQKKEIRSRDVFPHDEMVMVEDSSKNSIRKIVKTLRDVIPDDGILALDNGFYKLFVARDYPAYNPNTVLIDNALSTMGAGLPSAIAAKLLNQNKKVVVLCGDGGFMMNSQELETVARLNLDLVIVLLRDNELGMIKWKQDLHGYGDFGLKFDNPSFVALAEAYGARGYIAENNVEFADILKNVLPQKGIHLVEVPITYPKSF